MAAALRHWTDQLVVFEIATRQMQSVDQACDGDNRGAVLVVNGNRMSMSSRSRCSI